MKEINLVLENVDGMTFAAGITSVKEINEFYDDENSSKNLYEIADPMVSGPRINDFLREKVLACEMDGEKINIPICEIPVFNTNKEIMASNFFAPEQAEYVCNIVKHWVSGYYKTWSTGYRSDSKELIEVEETYSGDIYAELEFEGPFIKNNLFFIQADTLPFKEDSIIAAVGYKNPDDSITYDTFVDSSCRYDDFLVNFDQEEYSWDEFEKAFS